MKWGPTSSRRPRRSSAAPAPRLQSLLALIAGVGFGVCLALALATESWSSMKSPGGVALAVTRVSAMTGSWLLLVMVVLVARPAWIERTVGHDQLVLWHRKVAPWAIGLVTLHVLSSVLAYAQMFKVNVAVQLWNFWLHYPDMVSASVGFALLVLASVTSIRRIRSTMHYETWWIVHLYTYLGLGLAFAHQIRTGVMFLGHVVTTWSWLGLWVGTGVLVLLSRVGLPVVRNLQWRLRVDSVTETAPNVYSLTLKGRGLERMALSGGQFFQWRFLAPTLWWHSHPYSVSALARPPFMRVTVKGLGDHSRALATVKPGTRVFVEGPYGVFTRHAVTRPHVTLIGAGVGITPLRALLEDLPTSVDVTVLVRASTADDVVHGDEIRAFVERRNGTYHELLGPRSNVRLDASTLRHLVPRITDSDVFLCGPDDFMSTVRTVLRRLGVRNDQLHYEHFTF